jgi:hypothetical protein
MVQPPLQQRVAQLPNQSQVVLQLSVAAQPKPKKAKKSMEPAASNEKTKNSSLSERRGSIVKSTDKLASSIASDEASAATSASSASMMPMFMVMQMQQQQQQSQHLQQQMHYQQFMVQKEVEMQLKGVEAQVDIKTTGTCNSKVDVHQRSQIGKKQREGINTPTSP